MRKLFVENDSQVKPGVGGYACENVPAVPVVGNDEPGGKENQ
jgi:hypothetical protein